MNVTEVLQFADELVFQQTGKHLDDTQEVVIKGVWEGKTYEEIADQSNRSERHLRDVGYKLWKILSEKLGEDIHKSNFHSTFERLNERLKTSHNLNTQANHFVNIGINSHINLYPDSNNIIRDLSVNTNPEIPVKLPQTDLNLAPQISQFYNRETELENLSNWILNQKIRLLSVLGLSEVGKTALVKRFVDLNLDHFEGVIWRGLQFPQSLNLLIDDLLNIAQEMPKDTLPDKLKQLFKTLTNNRFLIILDDVQNLFISGEVTGQYQPVYKDYQRFFTMITEVEHQSHLILISQEQCAEMECLDEELYSLKCLEVSGLYDQSILSNMALQDQEIWLDLIDLYEGNFSYLKSIGFLIGKNYDGKVSDFLAENPLHITQKMQSDLREMFNKLSPQEQEIALQMSQFYQPISREDLRQRLNLSSVEFNNGLQSLQQRYLVSKLRQDQVLFKLSSVFGEYVKNNEG